MTQRFLFITGATLLVAGFALAFWLYQGAATGPAGEASTELQREDAPTKGASNARVTIVEFLDPACGTCAQFYPLVNDILERYQGQVRLVARYAPLHPGSDEVVKMLEAAHLQGQFWPALELLFVNQRRWVVNHRADPQRARRILGSLPLDQARLDNDMRTVPVTSAVGEDVRDGQALGVRATPEFFVDGEGLPSFGYQQLEALVRKAVDAAY